MIKPMIKSISPMVNPRSSDSQPGRNQCRSEEFRWSARRLLMANLRSPADQPEASQWSI